MSHAELDEATELDAGDPIGLAGEYAELKRRLPQLSVMGGCCGTDDRHIEQIATACLPLFRDAERMFASSRNRHPGCPSMSDRFDLASGDLEVQTEVRGEACVGGVRIVHESRCSQTR
jgi:hypothetical protein